MRSPQHQSRFTTQLILVLIALFIFAAIILVFSHNALSSHADGAGTQHLSSVPFPLQVPRRHAAQGLRPRATSSFVNNTTSIDIHLGAEVAPTSSFPLPSDAASASAEIVLRPTFGVHRPQRDAVFAFAEGYDLNVYATFIESLKNTGFTGDVVLSVSHVEGLKNGVGEYLEWYAQQGEDSLRVISYALQWECYRKSGARILPTNREGRGSTTNHGFSDCKINGLYSSEGEGKEDPRQARPVATARYELYWIWSRQYHKHSSMLIVDVRDTYFQSNPFHSQPAKQRTKEECILDLFAENYEAVNIGKSSYNSRWVQTAYGHKALKKISSQPVICSGSTMGSQRAIELYTMAMVAQFDRTECKQVGCDQGFHNYLIYEGGLKAFLASHGCSMKTHKQGEGIVNNLAAMRESPLRTQGVLSEGDNVVVLNDDKTPSPVVHQFDRDAELKDVIKKRTATLLTRWKLSRTGSHE